MYGTAAGAPRLSCNRSSTSLVQAIKTHETQGCPKGNSARDPRRVGQSINQIIQGQRELEVIDQVSSPGVVKGEQVSCGPQQYAEVLLV